MSDVRALTIRQPWAALIAAGIKPVENRSWPLPNSFGGPLLIHAGLRDDADGWAMPGVREALEGVEVVYGAVVAVAMSVACHECAGCCRERWGEPGVWHWTLGKVTALPQPIRATGRLGLWTPEPEAASAALAGSQTFGDASYRGRTEALPGAKWRHPRAR